MNSRAIVYALLSAALFGVSTPAAKVLLGSTDPTVLAGLLYCGAGLGVAIVRRLAGSIFTSSNAKEVALGRAHLPGFRRDHRRGIVGPVLLMID